MQICKEKNVYSITCPLGNPAGSLMSKFLINLKSVKMTSNLMRKKPGLSCNCYFYVKVRCQFDVFLTSRYSLNAL